MSNPSKRGLSAKEIADRPDSEIDYSDIPELSDDDLAQSYVSAPLSWPEITIRVPEHVLESFSAGDPRNAPYRIAKALIEVIEARKAKAAAE